MPVRVKCSERLARLLQGISPDETVPVWIFFTDRGGVGDVRRNGRGGPPGVSPRAVTRMRARASLAGRNSGLFPVNPACLNGVRPHVGRVRTISKYFNAASADVKAGEIPVICSFPFVGRIDIVNIFKREQAPEPAEPGLAGHVCGSGDPLREKYGESIFQLDQIQVVELLEMGYNGSGSVPGNPSPVLVCVLDTGFDREHEALRHINVIAEYDFVQGDSVTSNQEGDCGDQDRHGTIVLGAVAGYHEGDLIGPAWGADFLLAKTEIVDEEITIEEDNWIAGIEWADSAGADVVSSSLGYVLWYGKSDLDGETPLCTRAADIAGSRGIVVVNAVGNMGNYYSGSPPSNDTTLIAPADGDSVIAVGAVDRYGNIVHWSSRGPTADGRIKPDLAAMGYLTRSVDHPGGNGYAGHFGTSLATPLVAGLCALILEVHPGWTPAEVRDALIDSATRRDSPDNTYGYGIPRGLDASGLESPSFGETPVFSRAFPNPFNSETAFELFFPELEPVTVRVFDVRGAEVRTLVCDRYVKWGGTLHWDGADNRGRRVAGGVYFIRFTTRAVEKTMKVIHLP